MVTVAEGTADETDTVGSPMAKVDPRTTGTIINVGKDTKQRRRAMDTMTDFH
jgi:hypothetical protein